MQRLASLAGEAFLLAVTSSSVLAVLFIFYYIARDALPFFGLQGDPGVLRQHGLVSLPHPAGVRGPDHLLRQPHGGGGGRGGGRAAGGVRTASV